LEDATLDGLAPPLQDLLALLGIQCDDLHDLPPSRRLRLRPSP
jgi:hypothetical protein